MEIFLSKQFTKEALMSELTAPGNIFFIAWLDKEPAGYARMYKEGEMGNESVDLKRIYALQKFIGKGIGAALMQKCLDKARQLGKKQVVLGVWENNTRAIDFYFKWGFEKCGDQVFILGNDRQTDWIMKKDL
jgi:diamine N-acetyltransferase